MMLNFRTEIQPNLPDWKINHQTPVLTLGSCFAERTGEKLYRWHVPVSLNPWGTIFNPLAMEQILINALSGDEPDLGFTFAQDDVHFSLQYPSACFGYSPEQLKSSILDTNQYISEVFPQFKYLILTLGTAWVYRHRSTGKIVASCHKVPAREFDKILLSPDQVMHAIGNLIHQVRSLQPGIKILLTVSPVRHTRDTLELNAVSKSVLRYACHLLTEYTNDTTYFPAYEIMMDDLRDYRFYDTDLIHPSKEGIQYIWNVFCKHFFTAETMELNESIEALAIGLEHKPRVSGKAWFKHLERLEMQADKISRTFHIRMDRELEQIQELKAGLINPIHK